MTAYFITAIGTDSGKTYLTTALCKALRASKQDVFALKPVISGWVEGTAQNDTLRLIEALGLSRDAIDTISPWRYQAPLAAPMAAAREGKRVVFEEVVAFCHAALERYDGTLLIEGAGGVMSPLTEKTTILDLITALEIPVILVTNTYLGAISHTLTALAALEQQGAVVHAIVVNEVEKGALSVEEMLEALKEYTDVAVVKVERNGAVDEVLGVV